MSQLALTADRSLCQTVFTVQDYDLAGTLTSGQAFRWQYRDGAWEGVIGSRWLRLCSNRDTILAQTALPEPRWDWLADYLQLHLDLSSVLATFPDDAPMQMAVAACRGFRLLRQDPWECLASFILSSSKQIVQIQQIVALLCKRFGEPVGVPPGRETVYAFPPPGRIASCTEGELRDCKMGFRAPYLRSTARMIRDGEIDLCRLPTLPVNDAQAELMKLPGVGRKIADCVLLFACGFQEAFPVDVWVMKALRQLYFRRRRANLKRLQRFTATHFGPNAGYAQQYLFHYMRTQREVSAENRKPTKNA